MKFNSFIKKLNKRNGSQLAVLIDPDKFNPELVKLANTCKVSCFLVGGSVLERGNIKQTVKAIKALSKIPVILFPGDEHQLCANADGVFLPSLVSGRNPDYLIGKQVLMAPQIKKMRLPHLSMAYLLVKGNRESSTQKVTDTQPMGQSETKKIINTALAAQMLGFQLLYLEAGSGAANSVAASLIRAVKENTTLPLIVGGGISTRAKTIRVINAGANLVVVGNAFEKDVYLLPQISSCF
ncbi:MAG: geranylgeranylglyceryl/heptaprenylglyceryl phosphate synthase [Bacteroidia bacterium]|nr:geranylgeranylglyceryl/heptaprenylglyceryl phosphate synthase [Bacteroidia bacterium]